MDTKSITAVIIGLMVSGLILVAFVPVFTEVTATEETLYNEGSFFTVPDVNEHEIKITSSDGNIVITTDGESVIMPDMTLYGSATVVYAERTFIRLSSNGAVTLYGTSDLSTYGSINMGSATTGVTISISGDSATISDDSGNATTRTFQTIRYFIAKTGDYTLSSNPYVLPDSQIMGAGTTVVGGSNYAVDFYGTLDNLTVNGLWPSGRTGELDEINTSAYTPLVDVVKVDSIKINAYDGDTLLGVPTYTYFIAPYEITSEKTVHGDDVFNTVINIIPLLAGVGLLMAGVYYFITRR